MCRGVRRDRLQRATPKNDPSKNSNFTLTPSITKITSHVSGLLLVILQHFNERFKKL